MKKVKMFIEEMMEIFKDPMIGLLPGHLAFFFVLSFIPLLSSFVYLALMFSISNEAVYYFLLNNVPSMVTDVLMGIKTSPGISSQTILFTLFSFYLASNSMFAVINASNELYGIKDDKIIRLKLRSLLMTVLLLIAFIFGLLIPVIFNVFYSFISNISILNKLSIEIKDILSIINVFKIPVTIIFLYIIVKLIYKMAPSCRLTSRDVRYGALFTSVGWVIAINVYSYYISNFSRYDLYYGNMANVIILLMWFYIISYIFVIGIVLNKNYFNNKKFDIDVYKLFKRT